MGVLCAGVRLKEQSTLDSDRAKGLAVDLHRRDEETADLREKLADSKRQIQQVHKEVRLPPQDLRSHHSVALLLACGWR